MPEGHSVHRIARQFDRNFVGRTVAAASPQGRFVEGAAMIDGHEALSVRLAREGRHLGDAHDPELVLWLVGAHHGGRFADRTVVE